MRIGLDFDGVIATNAHVRSKHAKRLYNKDIPPELFMWDPLVTRGVLTPEQYEAVARATHDEDLQDRILELVDEAAIYLPRLIEEHDTAVITNRGGFTESLARRFLDEKGLQLPIYALGPGTCKADACDGIDVFVDNELHKLKPLIGKVPHILLYSWKYNEHLDESGIAQRVHGWKELYGKISDLVVGR